MLSRSHVITYTYPLPTFIYLHKLLKLIYILTLTTVRLMSHTNSPSSGCVEVFISQWYMRNHL